MPSVTPLAQQPSSSSATRSASPHATAVYHRRIPDRSGRAARVATWWTTAIVAGAWCGMAAAAKPADPAKAAPAKAAVVAFLDAVKRGDDAVARGMLSKVARAKTAEMGVSLAPPVPDTATYAVRDCEFVSDEGDVAHVATTWTDVSPDGTKSTENVVWVVRLDPEGWRVVGMALRVFDDMPPLLLNFEDPDDMAAKQEMVAVELEKRSRQPDPAKGPTSRTARGPATTGPGRK